MVAGFVPLAGLETEGGFAPGGHRAGTADRCTTLTTTVGVIAGVHHTASNLRTATEPAATTGLTQAGVAHLGVTDLAEGGVALAANQANLGGGQLQSDVVAFFRHHLGTGTGGTDHLATTTGVELNAVNRRTEGHRGQRHGVAVFDRGIRARDHGLAHLNSCRSKDVALLAIGVEEQC